MSTELLQSYYDWANATEVKLLEWVDPEGGWKVHPMADYPLANFASVYAICVGYLLFVIFGTALMKMGIPAIKTSPLQFVYNPIQVIACSYMCVEAGIQAYRNNYSAAPCNAFKADDPVMGNVLYLFFLSKILDLFDTLFIVVGKKWRQLSILHVYHHLSVLFVYYVTFRAAQDGDSYATIVLNGFVHTIMYTYYFVSAHTRDIWWKKYLTRIQLIQFVTMNVQGYLTYSRQCPGMPPKVPLMYLVYVQSLFWLFMNFYIRAYVFGPKKPAVEDSKKKLCRTYPEYLEECERQAVLKTSPILMMATPPPTAYDENESETPYKATPVWNVKATIIKYRMALAAVLLALIVVIILAATGVFSSSDSSDSSSATATTTGNVTIYHAGSLVGLMDDKLAPAFTAATGIATSLLAKGSVKLANLIVNGSQTDVFISADASVNTKLLMGDANDNLISWYITFGETSIGIGYYPESPYADVFEAVQNGSLLWYEALLQNPNMKLGRTDPDADPKGYRTVMMFELAEEYYNTTGLLSGILGNATNRDQIFSEENLETYLTSGDLDVGFFYAVEVGSLSGINFISLPEEINMGNPALDDEYATVSYTNSETGTVYNGSASIYTVAILNNATHMSEAEEFVEYLLSSDGQSILTEQGMDSANFSAYGDTSVIPEAIATYLA
ncbi:hypothetical protein JM18_002209 [Phytophthora kernoviae]|uniref:Very-long-chain 3-oxoacyl-CoA synthase n=2 Tax=Phytophthora kernoviae TaxID=325452 RepID=A0A922AR36_9STRA|nr:hypothetical protein G195_008718 [Phytophthora kernoviae 00238/432]KAG2530322.1 hypothetical protein JM18_002209 [Phytophthora kernoviae]